MTKGNRKIGLGIMGWADMLILLGIPYNSEQAITLAEKVMKFINDEGHTVSRALARTHGPFPNFNGSIYDKPGLEPIRNATVTTIAPTGTISIIANASSGIEPIFAVSFIRQVLNNNILLEVNPLFKRMAKACGVYSDPLMEKIAEHGTIQEIKEIPAELRKLFVTDHDIAPADHIRMQSAFQKYTDNAVSKTVNLSNTASIDDVRTVYELAHQLGCKGVTIYRDRSRERQVLSTGKAIQPADIGEKKAVRERPISLNGTTYKMLTGCGALYVTINKDEIGFFELFTAMGKAGGCASSQSESMARLVSLAWRSGVEPKQVIRQLLDISCHSHSGFGEKKVLSCADAVAKAIQLHLSSTGSTEKMEKHPLFKGAYPGCGGRLNHEEGCSKCHCGFSDCG